MAISADAWAEEPDLARPLRLTSSIIEGRVADVREDFDDRAGPTTTFFVEEVIAHLGEEAPETLELTFFGGHLPNGKYTRDTESPRLFVGGRYLLALRSEPWFFSPVLESFAYRIEEDDTGEDRLVAEDGRLILTVHPDGFDTSSFKVLDRPNGDNLFRHELFPVPDEARQLLERGARKRAVIDYLVGFADDHPLAATTHPERTDRQWNLFNASPPGPEDEILECPAELPPEDDAPSCSIEEGAQ